MDALEEARWLDPADFWAQMKLSELLYRLRELPRAEQETGRALELAGDAGQLALARAQLQEIRRLRCQQTRKPSWVKPLTRPGAWLAAMCAAASLLAILR